MKKLHLLVMVTMLHYYSEGFETSGYFHRIRNNATEMQREKKETEFYDEFPIIPDYFYYEEGVDDSYIGNGLEEYDFSRDEFQPLCQSIRRKVQLKGDQYEYRPKHYYEVVCRKFSSSGAHGDYDHGSSHGDYSHRNQRCVRDGLFRCVQRTQSIYVTRRKYDDSCWETTREVIHSGCDCMSHYEAEQARKIDRLL